MKRGSLIHIPSSGPLSNLDVKIDPLELQRSMKLEEHVSIMDDFLSTAGDGTYGYMGDYAEGQRLTAPKAAVDGLTKAQRVARVRHRMAEGKPPLLVSLHPESKTKIFMEEDKEAVEDGYICTNCVQYQAVPFAPKCNWLNNPDDGCGHQNY